jgi:hypothetical protein
MKIIILKLPRFLGGFLKGVLRIFHRDRGKKN